MLIKEKRNGGRKGQGIYFRRSNLTGIRGPDTAPNQQGHILGCSLIGEMASQVVPVVKNSLANAGDIRDTCSIPGSGISPGGENGNAPQYSCLENPTDRV